MMKRLRLLLTKQKRGYRQKYRYTFDRLDAVTWDTMSKSNNYSDGTTWHLNGEIPLCEVNLDLNYDGADSHVASLTRYAVKMAQSKHWTADTYPYKL